MHISIKKGATPENIEKILSGILQQNEELKKIQSIDLYVRFENIDGKVIDLTNIKTGHEIDKYMFKNLDEVELNNIDLNFLHKNKNFSWLSYGERKVLVKDLIEQHKQKVEAYYNSEEYRMKEAQRLAITIVQEKEELKGHIYIFKNDNDWYKTSIRRNEIFAVEMEALKNKGWEMTFRSYVGNTELIKEKLGKIKKNSGIETLRQGGNRVLYKFSDSVYMEFTEFVKEHEIEFLKIPRDEINEMIAAQAKELFDNKDWTPKRR